MAKASQPIPAPDEIKFLILRMIEQAIRDYLTLSKSVAPIDRDYYDSACQFLFDDEYVVEFGGANKTLRDFLELLDIEVNWFRERVMRLKVLKHNSIQIRRLIFEEEEDI